MIVIKDKFMVCLLRKFIIYGLFLLIVLVIFFDLKAWKSLNDEEKQNVRKKDIIVCLDPGHGGVKNGCQFVYDGVNVSEKDINLKISLKVKEYLKEHGGIRVVMTREEDKDIDLKERVKFAKNVYADYLVSIHNNSSGKDVNHKGCLAIVTQSYYNAPRAKVKSVYQSSEHLAKSMLAQLQKIGISITTDWEAHKNEGLLRRNCTDNSKYADGSSADYYTITYEATKIGLPSVLIETAFLSSESDYRNFLCDEKKLSSIARAVAEEIINHIF